MTDNGYTKISLPRCQGSSAIAARQPEISTTSCATKDADGIWKMAAPQSKMAVE
jgi:hypothetical protein